jgi:hypothetical protein
LPPHWSVNDGQYGYRRLKVQSGSDRAQLAPMAEKAKIALGVDQINVVADRGYFSAEHCHSTSTTFEMLSLFIPR